jgi:protein TonB
MGGLASNLFLPIKAAYIKLFEINKYFAVLVLSVFTTFFLFVLMVTLISLGDSGLKDDKSVKLADIVMPEREIDTFMEQVDKPDEPEEQPEDIAQPEVDLQPIAGIDVNIPKPKANFKAGAGSFFRDGEYIPLFKIQPQYPRRAQERGTMGFSIVAFTITETGTVEDVVPVEGMCSSKSPYDPEVQFRPCSIFNSASLRAALKLKYKPKIVDGKAVRVEGVQHRFTFIMEES